MSLNRPGDEEIRPQADRFQFSTNWPPTPQEGSGISRRARQAIQVGLVHFPQFFQLDVSDSAAFAGHAAFHQQVPNFRKILRREAILAGMRRRHSEDFSQIHNRMA